MTMATTVDSDSVGVKMQRILEARVGVISSRHGDSLTVWNNLTAVVPLFSTSEVYIPQHKTGLVTVQAYAIQATSRKYINHSRRRRWRNMSLPRTSNRPRRRRHARRRTLSLRGPIRGPRRKLNRRTSSIPSRNPQRRAWIHRIGTSGTDRDGRRWGSAMRRRRRRTRSRRTR